MSRTLFGLCGMLVLCHGTLAAQAPPPRRLTLGAVAGALIPTGSQRDNFKAATSAGAQVTYRVSRRFRVVAAGVWTHGHHKLPAAGDRVDIWLYDAGVEFHPCADCDGSWDVHPFAGLGAGARTNDYHAAAYGSHTCLAGYGGLGLEAQGRTMAVRLEGRDYLSCQESPVTGGKHTLNDVRVTLGVALRL